MSEFCLLSLRRVYSQKLLCSLTASCAFYLITHTHTHTHTGLQQALWIIDARWGIVRLQSSSAASLTDSFPLFSISWGSRNLGTNPNKREKPRSEWNIDPWNSPDGKQIQTTAVNNWRDSASPKLVYNRSDWTVTWGRYDYWKQISRIGRPRWCHASCVCVAERK